MSIRHRPDRPALPFEVRWREEGRHRSRSFPDEKKAIRFEGRVADRVALGAHAPAEPSRMRLGEWVERWQTVHGLAWEASTAKHRGWILDKNILPYLKGVKLRDLGRARIQTWRRDAAKTATPQTVNAATRVLSACLKDAAEEGLIPANPCFRLRPLPTPPVRRRPIPVATIRKITRAMKTPRDRAVVALLCYAGLRPGELRGLQWGDVSEDSIVVGRSLTDAGDVKRTKTHGVRVVPVRRELRRELDRLERGADTAFVVQGDRGGPLSWHNWTSRQWRDAREAAGSDHIPYEGRHTYASLLIAEGHSVVEVAGWLGHASPTTTLTHYSHLFEQLRGRRGRVGKPPR